MRPARVGALLLYCGGGHRSALAVHSLQRMGCQQMRSLAEGFTGWAKRDYPVEAQSRAVPRSEAIRSSSATLMRRCCGIVDAWLFPIAIVAWRGPCRC